MAKLKRNETFIFMLFQFC